MDRKEIQQMHSDIKDSLTIISAFLLKNDGDYDHVQNAMNNVWDTCERVIPKKVIFDGEYNPARCPRCDTELSEPYNDGYWKHWTSLTHCPDEGCHQAISWDND